MDHQHSGNRLACLKSPLGLLSTVVAVGLSVYLWIAHQNHLLAFLPYLFLAACPLMHMFMHGGHHGHHHGGSGGAPDNREPRKDEGR